MSHCLSGSDVFNGIYGNQRCKNSMWQVRSLRLLKFGYENNQNFRNKAKKYNKTGDQHRAISRHRRTRWSPGAPPSGGGTKERPNALVKRKVRPKLKIVIILKLFQTRMSFFPLLRIKEDILNVVKRLVHPNMKILSLITHPHVVSNPRRRRIWIKSFFFFSFAQKVFS